MLVGLENRSNLSLFKDLNHPNFRFAMLAAGFKPSSQKATQDFWTHKINTPTLHMIGMEDTLITPEMQQTLVDQCVEPSVIRHNGG